MYLELLTALQHDEEIPAQMLLSDDEDEVFS
jgi:hypothetical protein